MIISHPTFTSSYLHHCISIITSLPLSLILLTLSCHYCFGHHLLSTILLMCSLISLYITFHFISQTGPRWALIYLYWASSMMYFLILDLHNSSLLIDLLSLQSPLLLEAISLVLDGTPPPSLFSLNKVFETCLLYTHTTPGPDALFRRPREDNKEIEPYDDNWLDEIALFYSDYGPALWESNGILNAASSYPTADVLIAVETQ